MRVARAPFARQSGTLPAATSPPRRPLAPRGAAFAQPPDNSQTRQAPRWKKRAWRWPRPTAAPRRRRALGPTIGRPWNRQRKGCRRRETTAAKRRKQASLQVNWRCARMQIPPHYSSYSTFRFGIAALSAATPSGLTAVRCNSSDFKLGLVSRIFRPSSVTPV